MSMREKRDTKARKEVGEMAEKETRSLARWDPFEELDLFSGWSPFREYGPLAGRLARLLGEPGGAMGVRGRFAPSVDISEDDDRYVVTVELPGSKKDDVTVEMKDRVLTIRGEKRNEREQKKEQNRWIERSYGSFSRSFTLPANAVADRVKAGFDHGVLTIEVPKAEEAKPKVIAIK
jgi:HSP20 family protein